MNPSPKDLLPAASHFLENELCRLFLRQSESITAQPLWMWKVFPDGKVQVIRT
ncbi:MAG: hypothetical protein IPN95_23310 [Bacteroidetes bacterium]|nr:hypothetical protein [Bacteroidota bacterium]MBP6640201.1 hypothetical protein [Bacteroidia bacterium]MBP6721212.1 hypothetical protein [Bacteroidia bacterium]